MRNKRIKLALLEANMKQWQLADIIGISESMLCRKLRRELPDDEQNKIIALVQQHSKVVK